MPKVLILTMMFNVLDFGSRANKPHIINLRSEIEINNAQYPNVEIA